MGADGYIKKSFSQRLLAERNRALMRRQEFFSRDLVADEVKVHLLPRGAVTMDPMRHAVTWKDREILLTVKEFFCCRLWRNTPGLLKVLIS